MEKFERDISHLNALPPGHLPLAERDRFYEPCHMEDEDYVSREYVDDIDKPEE